MTQFPLSLRGGATLRALAVVLVLACPFPAWSVQDIHSTPATRAEEDPVAEYNRGVQAVKRGAFEEALRQFEDLIQRYEGVAFQRFGPAFGMVHYHAGLCLTQLRRYEKASEQFRICYEDFPNHFKKEDSQNPFKER